MEVNDSFCKGICRIILKLILEVAECNCAIVELLGALYLIVASAIRYKTMNTPILDTISGL